MNPAVAKRCSQCYCWGWRFWRLWWLRRNSFFHGARCDWHVGMSCASGRRRKRTASDETEASSLKSRCLASWICATPFSRLQLKLRCVSDRLRTCPPDPGRPRLQRHRLQSGGNWLVFAWWKLYELWLSQLRRYVFSSQTVIHDLLHSLDSRLQKHNAHHFWRARCLWPAHLRCGC